VSRARVAALALLARCAVESPVSVPPPAPCTAASAFPTTAVVLVADLMNPGCIQVPRGASVEFLNQDREMHTATDQAAPPAFDLTIPAGTSALTPALDGPAVIEAACTFHPAMRVTILVP
jgi:plastocyanin